MPEAAWSSPDPMKLVVHVAKKKRRRSLLMTKDRTVQHVGSTLPIPRKHVVGVFDSLQEGEQAVQALVDAGYHAEDMAFIPSQDFPSAFQERLQKEGLFRSEERRVGK